MAGTKRGTSRSFGTRTGGSLGTLGASGGTSFGTKSLAEASTYGTLPASDATLGTITEADPATTTTATTAQVQENAPPGTAVEEAATEPTGTAEEPGTSTDVTATDPAAGDTGTTGTDSTTAEAETTTSPGVSTTAGALSAGKGADSAGRVVGRAGRTNSTASTTPGTLAAANAAAFGTQAAVPSTKGGSVAPEWWSAFASISGTSWVAGDGSQRAFQTRDGGKLSSEEWAGLATASADDVPVPGAPRDLDPPPLTPRRQIEPGPVGAQLPHRARWGMRLGVNRAHIDTSDEFGTSSVESAYRYGVTAAIFDSLGAGAAGEPHLGAKFDCDGGSNGCGPVSGSLADAVEYVGEEAGYALAGAGDVNGDGYDDVLFAAPGAYSGAGRVNLVLGGPTPTSGSLLGALEYTGVTQFDYAGYSVSGAGDVNSDGYADVVIGTSFDHDHGDYAGAAYLVLGSANPVSASLSTAVIYTGGSADYGAGSSVAGAGDVNGDGYDDVLVGAGLNSEAGYHAGAVYLIFGGAGPVSASLDDVEHFTGVRNESAGGSVSGPGDIDGDGLDDVVAGAGGYSGTDGAEGASYLVLGAPCLTFGSLSGAIRYTGPPGLVYWQEGSGVSDVNADGYDDLVAGGYDPNDDGSFVTAVYLMLGGAAPTSGSWSTAIQYARETTRDFAGMSVGAAGDVDGDGFDDLVVGAPYDGGVGVGDAYGAAYLLLGRAAPAADTLASAVKFTGEEPFNLVGWAVGGGGDVDADGHDDLLVGAPFATDDKAYLILGSGL